MTIYRIRYCGDYGSMSLPYWARTIKGAYKQWEDAFPAGEAYLIGCGMRQEVEQKTCSLFKWFFK